MNNTREQTVAEILNQLEKGVRDVYESEKWRKYLSVMSRFHSYSFSNSLLIFLQRPDASHVAGYSVWNTQFHRQVRKGEKGIRILAPLRRKAEEEDPEGVYVITGFRPVYVFDISQTDGEPVPVNLCENLQDAVDDYSAFLEALILASDVPVRFEKTPEGVNGFYSVNEKVITVNTGMSEAQTVKTLLHESAHALLHADRIIASKTDQAMREVEAESVAYAVSSYYGIDTSSYSFSYIAAWAKDRELKGLKESLETIRYASDHMISLINAVRNPVPGSRNRKPDHDPVSVSYSF